MTVANLAASAGLLASPSNNGLKLIKLSNWESLESFLVKKRYSGLRPKIFLHKVVISAANSALWVTKRVSPSLTVEITASVKLSASE